MMSAPEDLLSVPNAEDGKNGLKKVHVKDSENGAHDNQVNIQSEFQDSVIDQLTW